MSALPLPDLALLALEQWVAPREKPTGEMTSGEYLLHLAQRYESMIPDEEWDRIPTDASVNYKHYLYGHRKAEG